MHKVSGALLVAVMVVTGLVSGNGLAEGVASSCHDHDAAHAHGDAPGSAIAAADRAHVPAGEYLDAGDHLGADEDPGGPVPVQKVHSHAACCCGPVALPVQDVLIVQRMLRPGHRVPLAALVPAGVMTSPPLRPPQNLRV